MTLRKLPEAKNFARPENFQWDAPSDVLAKWADSPMAAEGDDPNTVSIYDVIGEDFWTGGGFTAKRMAGALRSIGDNPVTVNVNSPGGDMFEGIAIYNLLREHKNEVTINVMGWAASAASILAMAGDNINMGLGTFMMVHNAWGGVIGNRHEMRAAADIFDGFDFAIADIYEARTGMKRDDIVKLMDADTFMGPTDAVAKGFADSIDNNLKIEASASGQSEINAKRRLDAILAQSNVPRSERRRMIKEATGKQDAAGNATHNAGINPAALQQLFDTIKI